MKTEIEVMATENHVQSKMIGISELALNLKFALIDDIKKGVTEYSAMSLVEYIDRITIETLEKTLDGTKKK